jgi:PAS domain S-box-containing protein
MDARPLLLDLDEDAALRSILRGTATETGEHFFFALVESLAQALGTYGAWVTEYLPEQRKLRALAFWLDGNFLPFWEHHIDNTPCQRVIETAELVHYPDRVLDLFPTDPDLNATNAMSYMGAPLLDEDGTVIGHMAVLDPRPMPPQPRVEALFRIFAARAAAELRRVRAEAAVHEREEKLGRLVSTAMDAIVELDHGLRVTLMNPAAEKICAAPAAAMVGRGVGQLLDEVSRDKLAGLIAELDARPAGERSLWIPGGLQVRCGARDFTAEATLSRSDARGEAFYTLILRDVNERIEAERRIRALTDEAEYLREEIRALHNFDEIIGRSEPLLRALRDVAQVAPTDSTVLILGETGTGKELFARAIHQASPRAARPMVRVNCAAIPANLMESEFFGHERGAFTGATGKRVGRFALADGGTIFLDEVGELPFDLQSKLLRVLQEGEFEAVGSSRTQKIDVRVIAATNRDLPREIEGGRFREDLYYRLNVFPIAIPPLRERGDDIPLLAEGFARQFGKRFGRSFAPLTPACAQRLKAYSWPGNVRELANVIERAAITAHNGRLNLDRALPDTPDITALPPAPEEQARVRTVRELEELERRNILLALEQTAWRVAGDSGAAALLGMKPSTLSSRIKALNISRPG